MKGVKGRVQPQARPGGDRVLRIGFARSRLRPYLTLPDLALLSPPPIAKVNSRASHGPFSPNQDPLSRLLRPGSGDDGAYDRLLTLTQGVDCRGYEGT